MGMARSRSALSGQRVDAAAWKDTLIERPRLVAPVALAPNTSQPVSSPARVIESPVRPAVKSSHEAAPLGAIRRGFALVAQ